MIGRYSLTTKVVVFFGSTVSRKRWKDAELSAGSSSSVGFTAGRAGCSIRTGGGIPYRDFLGINARVQDRHQRRLILADGDTIFELVLEQVSEFAGLAYGGPGFERFCDFSGVGARHAAAHTKDSATNTPTSAWTEAWAAA